MMRIMWLLVGWLCVVLAVLGAALPLLPTTPFLLLAAFGFARSSPRFHSWLVEHPIFGPSIRNWQREGAISASAKRLAVVSMAAVLIVSWALGASVWILGVQATVLLCAGAFVLSRPSPRSER